MFLVYKNHKRFTPLVTKIYSKSCICTAYNKIHSFGNRIYWKYHLRFDDFIQYFIYTINDTKAVNNKAADVNIAVFNVILEYQITSNNRKVITLNTIIITKISLIFFYIYDWLSRINYIGLIFYKNNSYWDSWCSIFIRTKYLQYSRD